MMTETHASVGYLLIAIGSLAFAIMVRRSPTLKAVGTLLTVAMLLRIAGSIARYEILMNVYDGVGDAWGYYHTGKLYADMLVNLDFDSYFHLPEFASWWGTHFVRWVSGAVLAFIGPTFRGEFVAFSLIAFGGVVFFVMAHTRAVGRVSVTYVALVSLLPSFCFWPSSIGKDALVLFGAGLTVYGYVGVSKRISWVPMGLGLVAAFVIRPHVAAALAASIFAGEWFSRSRLTLGRALQMIIVGSMLIFALAQTARQFGFDATDLQGAQEFYSFRAGQTQMGGSTIGEASGVAAIPMAFVNILVRPFIFEAHNVLAFISGLEMTVLWFLIYRRRRSIKTALRQWREHRFLRIALPLLVLYTLMLGLTFSNLGLIARQRTLVWPLLLAIVAGVPAAPEKTGLAGDANSDDGPKAATT